jgi:hypothetical protein
MMVVMGAQARGGRNGVVGVGLLGVLFVGTAVLGHAASSSRSIWPAAFPRTSDLPAVAGEVGSYASDCSASALQTGDIDGDQRLDTVDVVGRTDNSWLVRVHRGSGQIEEINVARECSTLLGLADVNSDRRQEIWFKTGIGNTAHGFDLIAWTGEALRVVVSSDVESPLVVGWGFSGGATLWCADATEDGRTDIVQQVFDRKPDGSPDNERELVYHLEGSQLREVSEGRPRTPFPDSASALTCGTVTW